MAEVHLLLGTNLGDRLKNLEKAREYLNKFAGTINGSSQIFITQPWGFETQDMFYNQAVLLETQLFPKELLLKLKNIENFMGRKSSTNGYSSRIIDIDILFYENMIIDHPELVVPHPRMTERRFVLEPLSQLSPDKEHPLHKKTSKELLAECEDKNFVIRL